MKINPDKYIKQLDQYLSGMIDLSPNQLRAIDILLKKSLPDLKSEETHGTTQSNITITIRQEPT